MVSPNTTLVDPFPFLEEETGHLRSTAADQLTCTPVLGAVAMEVLYPAVESPGSQLSHWGVRCTSAVPWPWQGEQAWEGAVGLTGGSSALQWLEVP